MTAFTLHGFWESGHSFKVALMLQLNNADWRCERVAFFTGETRRPDYRALNVMGEAPVLIHHREDGNFTLTQSGACLTYLAKHFGTFGPQTEAEEYDVLRWLLFDTHKLSGQTGVLRFLRIFAKRPDEPETAWIAGRVRSALGVLDAALEDKTWLVGERPTIADLANQAYLHWPQDMGLTYADYPNIAAWLERIRALPGFKDSIELMPSKQDTQTATA